eukprot:scaffold198702_cov22-Tisochrysis_lutea.AAC.1
MPCRNHVTAELCLGNDSLQAYLVLSNPSLGHHFMVHQARHAPGRCDTINQYHRWWQLSCDSISTVYFIVELDAQEVAVSSSKQCQ